MAGPFFSCLIVATKGVVNTRRGRKKEKEKRRRREEGENSRHVRGRADL